MVCLIIKKDSVAKRPSFAESMLVILSQSFLLKICRSGNEEGKWTKNTYLTIKSSPFFSTSIDHSVTISNLPYFFTSNKLCSLFFDINLFPKGVNFANSF